MRNIGVDSVKIKKLPVETTDVKRYVEVDDTFFVLSGMCVHYFNNGKNEVLKNDALTIDWIPVENILCMGDGHNFECFNIQTKENIIIEVPGGYTVHQWNSSQDRLALVDANGTVKVITLDTYNAQCTVIGEYYLEATETSNFIHVGWGSQDTQFRGSAGKLINKKSDNDEESKTVLDNSIHISWRDEGDLFAVSFVRDDRRIFKILSCECDFLYESEYRPGLSPEITWKPDGSLIATEIRSPNGHNITFFEKNGLYRFDLKLPDNKNVKKIQWSPLGDILMIWQQSLDDENHISDIISLWTFTNFKWYLKHSLTYNRENVVKYVEWCDKMRLEVLTVNDVIRYSWKYEVYCSHNSIGVDCDNSINLGAVAVIDGKTLRVTITSMHIVPPPHGTYEAEFEKPINSVAFGMKHNVVAIILADYTVKILQIEKSTCTTINTFVLTPTCTGLPLMLNHFMYDDTSGHHLYCIELLPEQFAVNRYTFDATSSELRVDKYYESAENITDLFRVRNLTGDLHIAVCEGGRAMACHVDEEMQMLIPDADMILVEDTIEGGGSSTVVHLDDSFHVFCLRNYNFYYNGKKVANNITSYLFCLGYMLVTTTNNKLLCVKLSQKGLNNLGVKNLSHAYTRNIANGGLLINAVPNTRKVILQVPRGELEVINPRVLAIDEIDRLLEKKHHLEAYMIMRTDRINPNLLYDINSTRFLKDVEDFIKNVDNCEYLDVFLTQLQESNVTSEMYTKCFEDPLPNSDGNKIRIVADSMIDAMKKVDLNYYLQSLITACICKGTPADLEHALIELVSAKKREKSGEKFRVPIDTTLEHMILLSSVEMIYDTALGMDKLDLIMWVASKSQLDPMDYIPFLHELVNMDDNYRNYKINYHIKRFEKAFQYLIKCDNVLDELTEFVTKHGFYNFILKYVQPNNQWYKPLLRIHGSNLRKEGHVKEAGLIFLKINENKMALDSFIEACCTTEALIALNGLKYTETEKSNVLQELICFLINFQKYRDASNIYENHLNNYEEAIAVLVKGKLWVDAYHLSLKYNREDIIESEIKPAVLSHTDELNSTVSTLEKEFITLKERLQSVRTEKIDQIKNGHTFQNGATYNEQAAGYITGEVDLESVVSTNYTATSQRTKNSHMTSASSKRKKRIERKVLQIREGSAFENIAVIRRLHVIITDMQKLAETIRDTCTQLFIFSDGFEKAQMLQELYERVFDNMVAAADQIWPAEMLIPSNPPTAESQAYSYNIEHLDIQYRFPPQNVKRNWKKINSLV